MYVVFRRDDGFIHAVHTSRSMAEARMREPEARQGFTYLAMFDEWRDAKICIWAKRLEQGWQPLFVTDSEAGDMGKAPGPVGIVCEGSFFCTQQATRLIDHPKWKKVPICDHDHDPEGFDPS